MGFWKTLFGGEEGNPEEVKKNDEARNFDLLKYDGVKALRMHQTDYAVKCFREALKIQDDTETRDYLQQALIRAGRLDEALDELNMLARLSPGNPQVLAQAAHVAYMLEDYAQMESLARQMLDGDSRLALGHYLLAQACIGQQRTDEAIDHLTQAISLQDDMADARLLRGRTLMAAGRTAEAQADADWLMEQADDHEDVLLLAARLANKQGDNPKAIALYDRMIELNPFQLDAYRERGALRLAMGDAAGADEDREKLLELDPQALADVSSADSAEGIEQQTRQAYQNNNPFGF